MTDHQNFKNSGEEFNIHLEGNGDLTFRANDLDGAGDTRMVINHDTAQVTIGGHGKSGQVQLTSDGGVDTIFLGESGSEASLLLGGNSGEPGRIQLSNGSGVTTIDLQGDGARIVAGGGNTGVDGDVQATNSEGLSTAALAGGQGHLHLTDGRGALRVHLKGDTGSFQLADANGVVMVEYDGTAEVLTVGASAGGHPGKIVLLDDTGSPTITLDGKTGTIS